MQDEKKIELQLLRDKDLFLKISDQKDLFIQLFSELGNHFPAQKLSLIHTDSRGCSTSKGNQLENCPYQVLDLIRDFDPVSGLNIRILNWWGHGLYVFILYGSHTARHYQKVIEILKEEFFISLTGNPWAYSQMVMNDQNKEEWNLSKHLAEYQHVQLFRPMEISESVAETLKLLIKTIGKLLDYHGQSFPS